MDGKWADLRYDGEKAKVTMSKCFPLPFLGSNDNWQDNYLYSHKDLVRMTLLASHQAASQSSEVWLKKKG